MRTKQAAGKMIQIATPIVEPTSPITSSIDGMRIPKPSDVSTINMVSGLNFDSGI